jgi:hypothetical protein
MTPKGADLEATDLIEVSTLESGSYVTRSITGQELIDAIPLPPSGLTVGTTPIASGTVGRVLFEGTGNVLQQSGNLFWDNTNGRLGIGTSSPTTKINIVTPNNGDALRLEVPSTNSTVYDFYLGNLDNSAYIRANTRILELRRQGASSIIRTVGGVLNDLALQADGGITLSTYGTNERMRVVGSTGNVLIGTTTDAGFKLDVNGTARLNNSVTAQTVSGINVLDVGNVRIADDPNGRYIQAVNTLIIRSTNNASALLVSSVTTNSWDASQLIRIRPQSGIGGVQFSTTSTSSPSNSIMTFLRQRNDGAKLAIINSEDFAASGQLPVNLFIHAGRETVSNNQANLILCHDGTSSRGNLLINTTTDAGFRLDVNGTARVQNEFLINRSDGIEMFRMFNSAAVLAFNANNSSTPTFRLHSQAGVLFYLKASENRIGINTISPNASAILDVASTTQGFLPPRMTTTQKNAIASPATGLQVFDTTLNQMSYYNGTTWTNI